MWSLLFACRPDPLPPPLSLTIDGEPVARVSVPLSGGAAAANERWVAAADVDGDRLLILATHDRRVREVTFPEGYAPSVVALDGDQVAVTLPGAGAVALVQMEPLQAEVWPVCPEPRGLDLAGGRLGVACAGGELVLPGERRLEIERDLRDLLFEEGQTALVTLLREATVLRVDLEDGAILDRYPLPVLPDLEGRPLLSRVARRMVRVGDGRVAVLHQAHVTDAIPLSLVGTAPYGTGACEAVARPLITWLGPDGPEGSVRLDAVLPTDLAFWPEGDGAFSEPTPVVGSVLADASGLSRGSVSSAYPPSGMSDPALFCVARGQLLATDGLVAGVAVGPDGPLAVTRQPFGIEDLSGSWLEPSEQALQAPDPGMLLFHRAAPSGVACASCHVDGREDGHVWRFADMGERRTQSLAGGLLETAPFHWDGTLASLGALFLDTGVARMGLAPVPPSEIEALGAWLDALPAPAPSRETGPEEGERLFVEKGCAGCHDPPSSQGWDVGTGGLFQAPALRGLEARLPLMHNGCARTLRERFDPACGGESHGEPLTAEEIELLVQHLQAR